MSAEPTKPPAAPSPPVKPTRETCGTCAAFEPGNADAKQGCCHQQPPLVYRYNTENVYPPVHAEKDWCLQHSKVKAPAKKKA